MSPCVRRDSSALLFSLLSPLPQAPGILQGTSLTDYLGHNDRQEEVEREEDESEVAEEMLVGTSMDGGTWLSITTSFRLSLPPSLPLPRCLFSPSYTE